MLRSVLIWFVVFLIVVVFSGMFAFVRMVSVPYSIRKTQELVGLNIDDYVKSIDGVKVYYKLGEDEYIRFLFTLKEGKTQELDEKLQDVGLDIDVDTYKGSEWVSEAYELLGSTSFDVAKTIFRSGKSSKTREIRILGSKNKLLIMG